MQVLWANIRDSGNKKNTESQKEDLDSIKTQKIARQSETH